MAITEVRRPVRTETRQRRGSIDPLAATASVLGVVGAGFSGNPAAIGGSLIGASQALKVPTATQQVAVQDQNISQPSGGAIARRAQLAGQDSARALQEAMASLDALTIDPETKAGLQAPLLKAMQTGRA